MFNMQKFMKHHQDGVVFGGLHIPKDYLAMGTLFMGAPGGGKSSLMKLAIAQCAAQGMGGAVLNIGENYREAIYAATRHFNPLGGAINILSLSDWKRPATIVDIGAHDQVGAGIDFAAMITSANKRVRFCEKLAPLSEGANVFFDARVQIILHSCLEALHDLAPGRWLLRDVLNLAFNSELLEHITELTKVQNPYLAFGRSAENRTRSDVQATVEAKLLPLRVYAALNANAHRLVNPLDAVYNENTWHIYHWDDATAAVNEGVISFCFDEMAMQVMNRRGNPFVFALDEVASLKPLNFLLSAGRRGRKSNLILFAAMHEHTSMCEYKDKAEEILALMQNKFFFRLASPQAAKWASDYLGSPEVIESIKPELERDNGGTTQRQRSIKDRPLVHPDQLRTLPLANWKNDRIEGYSILADGTVMKFWTPFREFTEGLSDHFNVPTHEECEDLAPMTVEDLIRLNIPTDPRTVSLLDVHKRTKSRTTIEVKSKKPRKSSKVKKPLSSSEAAEGPEAQS